MIIARTTETPKKWTTKVLKEMYPGATILGTPYGWFHYVKETNCAFLDYSWGELVKRVAAHMRGNDIRVPADLSLEMMAEFCRITNSDACADEDKTHTERQKWMAMSARFLRAMEDAVINGLVDQETANRRAEICSRCPYNQKEKYQTCTVGCAAKSAAAKVAKMALGVSTPYDDKLLSCSVCWCRNALKVWSKQTIADYPGLENDWWSECWLRAESQPV